VKPPSTWRRHQNRDIDALARADGADEHFRATAHTVANVAPLQFDGLTRSYVIEHKYTAGEFPVWFEEVLVAGGEVEWKKRWRQEEWEKVQQRAAEFRKEPCMILRRPGLELHVITGERHRSLCEAERELIRLREEPVESPPEEHSQSLRRIRGELERALPHLKRALKEAKANG